MKYLYTLVTFLFVLCLMGSCGSLVANQKPDTFAARKRLTHELIARQDWPEAFFYANQLYRERPSDMEVLVLRGTIYREQGLSTEAETDLREALRSKDDFAEAHAALGLLLDENKRGKEAEKHHSLANTFAPNNAMYLNNHGFSLFLRGKSSDAIKLFQRAASLDPTNRRIRTNLGFAYATVGDWPRAAQEFEKGSANRARAKNNLGFAYERRGDLAIAFALYIEAVRLDPQCEKARTNLTLAAEKLGKPLPNDLPTAILDKETKAQP